MYDVCTLYIRYKLYILHIHFISVSIDSHSELRSLHCGKGMSKNSTQQLYKSYTKMNDVRLEKASCIHLRIFLKAYSIHLDALCMLT